MNTLSNQSTPKVDIYSGGPVNPAYMIAVLQAALNGKKIQYRSLASLDNQYANWNDLNLPVLDRAWDWVNFTFRVDPTDRPKKIVPLDISDLGAITWIRGPRIFGEGLIVGIHGALINVNNTKDTTQAMSLMGLFDQSNNCGTHEYSIDRKTWLPTHKEVVAD